MDPRYAAIVLAGGRSVRMGGRHKPALPVDGVPMLHRVLAAVVDAAPRVVVGPPQPVPPGVRVVREDPPYGGPAAAIAAGLAAITPTPTPGYVAVLAADQPYVTGAAMAVLREALAAAGPPYVGAAYVDGGRPQLLCSLWRVDALARRRTELDRVTDLPVRRFFADLPYVPVRSTATTPPWYDCDTEADWAACTRGAPRSVAPRRARGGE